MTEFPADGPGNHAKVLMRDNPGLDASPMAGDGFRQGLYDVRALAQAMTGSPDEVPAALGRYQKARLAAAIRHVTRSEQETAAYLAYAGAR